MSNSRAPASAVLEAQTRFLNDLNTCENLDLAARTSSIVLLYSQMSMCATDSCTERPWFADMRFAKLLMRSVALALGKHATLPQAEHELECIIITMLCRCLTLCLPGLEKTGAGVTDRAVKAELSVAATRTGLLAALTAASSALVPIIQQLHSSMMQHGAESSNSSSSSSSRPPAEQLHLPMLAELGLQMVSLYSYIFVAWPGKLITGANNSNGMAACVLPAADLAAAVLHLLHSKASGSASNSASSSSSNSRNSAFRGASKGKAAVISSVSSLTKLQKSMPKSLTSVGRIAGSIAHVICEENLLDSNDRLAGMVLGSESVLQLLLLHMACGAGALQQKQGGFGLPAASSNGSSRSRGRHSSGGGGGGGSGGGGGGASSGMNRRSIKATPAAKAPQQQQQQLSVAHFELLEVLGWPLDCIPETYWRSMELPPGAAAVALQAVSNVLRHRTAQQQQQQQQTPTSTSGSSSSNSAAAVQDMLLAPKLHKPVLQVVLQLMLLEQAPWTLAAGLDVFTGIVVHMMWFKKTVTTQSSAAAAAAAASVGGGTSAAAAPAAGGATAVAVDLAAVWELLLPIDQLLVPAMLRWYEAAVADADAAADAVKLREVNNLWVEMGRAVVTWHTIAVTDCPQLVTAAFKQQPAAVCAAREAAIRAEATYRRPQHLQQLTQNLFVSCRDHVQLLTSCVGVPTVGPAGETATAVPGETAAAVTVAPLHCSTGQLLSVVFTPTAATAEAEAAGQTVAAAAGKQLFSLLLTYVKACSSSIATGAVPALLVAKRVETAARVAAAAAWFAEQGIAATAGDATVLNSSSDEGSSSNSRDRGSSSSSSIGSTLLPSAAAAAAALPWRVLAARSIEAAGSLLAQMVQHEAAVLAATSDDDGDDDDDPSHGGSHEHWVREWLISIELKKRLGPMAATVDWLGNNSSLASMAMGDCCQTDQEQQQQQHDEALQLSGLMRETAAVAQAVAVDLAAGLTALTQQPAPAADTASAIAAAGADTMEEESLLSLGQRLQQFGASMCAQLPCQDCCNNPACLNMAKASELVLVGGKACICGGCKTARYCSKECQTAHWQQHKGVCKRIKKAARAAA